MKRDSPTHPPRVWVLLGKGTGGNGQMKGLAEALGWPYETKQLAYGRLNRIPNLVLGPSLLSVERRRSSPLEPPWPDLVIAGSRRSVPVARWIKRRSRGRTRLVHLMHTQAPIGRFDLVITTPQYRLPDLPNILHNTVPLNRIPQDRLSAAGARWHPRFEDFDRIDTAETLGNRSLLFARGGGSWHGVREIRCPPSTYRKVFIVVVNDRTAPLRAAVKARFREVRRRR